MNLDELRLNKKELINDEVLSNYHDYRRQDQEQRLVDGQTKGEDHPPQNGVRYEADDPSVQKESIDSILKKYAPKKSEDRRSEPTEETVEIDKNLRKMKELATVKERDEDSEEQGAKEEERAENERRSEEQRRASERVKQEALQREKQQEVDRVKREASELRKRQEQMEVQAQRAKQEEEERQWHRQEEERQREVQEARQRAEAARNDVYQPIANEGFDEEGEEPYVSGGDGGYKNDGFAHAIPNIADSNNELPGNNQPVRITNSKEQLPYSPDPVPDNNAALKDNKKAAIGSLVDDFDYDFDAEMDSKAPQPGKELAKPKREDFEYHYEDEILDDEFEEPSRKDLDSMLESGANGKPGVSRVASSGRGLEDYDFDDL